MIGLEEVIAAGKFGYWQCVALNPWWLWVISFAALIIGILWFIGSYDELCGPDFASEIIAIVGIFGTIACFSGNWGRTELINQWKTDYAYPYIYSLPDEKHEIVYVKIDPEIKTDIRGNMWYVYSTSTMLTPLTVSFKGNGVETYTQWYDASMSLIDSDRPYITFKRLTQDLGNDINAGMYQPKVYLPESYKFTDIK